MNSKIVHYNSKYKEPESSMFQMLDDTGRIIYVNENWLAETGYKMEEVLGRFFGEFLTKDALPEVKRNFPHLKDYGFVNNVLLKLRKKDGIVIETVLNGISVYDENGKFINTRCEMKNLNYFLNSINEIKSMMVQEKFLKGLLYIKSEVNKAVANSTCLEEFLHSAIKVLEEPFEVGHVYIKDYDYGYMCSDDLCNNMRLKLDNFLVDQEVMLSSKKNEILFMDNDKNFELMADVKKAFNDAASVAILPVKVKKNNIEKFLAFTIVFTSDLGPFKEEWVDFLKELAKLLSVGVVNMGIQEEMETLLRKLYSISTKDAITGVYNRYKFDVILEEQRMRFKRDGVPFSIIMYDIDGFKSINDNYGHMVGDYILKEVSDVVEGSIRKQDKVFRWGGDEFIIIMPGIDKEEAMHITERLKEGLSIHEFKVKDTTCSFGVTEVKENDTVSSILKRMDKALHKSKGNGKNTITML